MNRNYFDIDTFDLLITGFGIEFKQHNETFEIKWKRIFHTEFIKEDNSIVIRYKGLLFENTVNLDLSKYDNDIQIQIIDVFETLSQKHLYKKLVMSVE